MSHLAYFIGLNSVKNIQIDFFEDIDLSTIQNIIYPKKIYELDI